MPFPISLLIQIAEYPDFQKRYDLFQSIIQNWGAGTGGAGGSIAPPIFGK